MAPAREGSSLSEASRKAKRGTRTSHALDELSRDRVACLVVEKGQQEPARESAQERCTRSPAALTCIAPRMETSTCPPRIMPKLSTLSKTEAPGTSVTVSFPALMRSLRLRISFGERARCEGLTRQPRLQSGRVPFPEFRSRSEATP